MITTFYTYSFLSVVDIIIVPFFLLVIFIIEWSKYRRKRETLAYYRYYLPGLFVKLFAGIALCFIYVYYYKSGDTMAYFYDGTCITNLFIKNPFSALQVTIQGKTDLTWLMFDDYTGYPMYNYDKTAFFVDRLTWPLCLISFKSYIGETILIAWISFYAVWKLYETLLEEFPSLQKQFAIAVLFIPSVFFWGSGLLKDTITFASVCLFTSGFYGLVIKKRMFIKNALLIIVSSYLLLCIKPYILFALLPGTFIWVAGISLSKISSSIFRWLIAPLFIVFTIASVFLTLKFLGNSLGDYELSKILDKAAITQQDLKRDEYGGASFDIGDFDPTATGVLKKAPLAINAALFRPYIWESRNPVMLLSGLENMAMMIFSIYLVLRLKVYNVFRLMFRHNLLAFTISFSLFFAFAVGLTTSNFGSMVRYKIPAIPFYVASLFIIRYAYLEMKKEDEKRTQVTDEDETKPKPVILSP